MQASTKKLREQIGMQLIERMKSFNTAELSVSKVFKTKRRDVKNIPQSAKIMDWLTIEWTSGHGPRGKEPVILVYLAAEEILRDGNDRLLCIINMLNQARGNLQAYVLAEIRQTSGAKPSETFSLVRIFNDFANFDDALAAYKVMQP